MLTCTYINGIQSFAHRHNYRIFHASGDLEAFGNPGSIVNVIPILFYGIPKTFFIPAFLVKIPDHSWHEKTMYVVIDIKSDLLTLS